MKLCRVAWRESAADSRSTFIDFDKSSKFGNPFNFNKLLLAAARQFTERKLTGQDIQPEGHHYENIRLA